MPGSSQAATPIRPAVAKEYSANANQMGKSPRPAGVAKLRLGLPSASLLALALSTL